MFENPRRGWQARNFTNVSKIIDLKSSSEQIFSENWRWAGPWLNIKLSRIWTATNHLGNRASAVNRAHVKWPLEDHYQGSNAVYHSGEGNIYMIMERLSFWDEFIPSPYISLCLFTWYKRDSSSPFKSCIFNWFSSGFQSDWNSRSGMKFH